jgi:hypothetical protein
MQNMTEEQVLLGGLDKAFLELSSPEARGYRRLSPPPYEITAELAKKKKNEDNRSSLVHRCNGTTAGLGLLEVI